MAQTIVTIIDPLGDNSFQVELPDDAPMNELLPQLLPRLGIHSKGSFQLQHRATERILGPSDTLSSVDVQRGDTLRIVQAASAAGGIPIRSFRDVQLVEAVLHNSDLISWADGRLLFAIFLYTEEDKELASYVRSHIQALHVMSGKCMFFVIEEPSPEWRLNTIQYLQGLSGKYFDVLWERLGTDSYRPFAKPEAYEIGRRLGVLPQQFPCALFFSELRRNEVLIVELRRFIPNSAEPATEYTEFFRMLFSHAERASDSDWDKSLKILAELLNTEERRTRRALSRNVDPTKLTVTVIEIIGALVKSLLK